MQYVSLNQPPKFRNHSCFYWNDFRGKKSNLFFSLFDVLLFCRMSLDFEQTGWADPLWTWTARSSTPFLVSRVLLQKDLTTIFLLLFCIIWVLGLRSFRYKKHLDLGYVHVDKVQKVLLLYLCFMWLQITIVYLKFIIFAMFKLAKSTGSGCAGNPFLLIHSMPWIDSVIFLTFFMNHY